MPYPFARSWSRPDAVGTVCVVDERGRALRTAHLSTSGKTYTAVLNDILRIAASLPAWAVEDRMNGRDADHAQGPAPVDGRGGGALALWEGALRHGAWRLAEAPKIELWRVGLADQPIHRFLDETSNPEVKWLTPQEGAAYCADPFAHPDDPEDIWWERYDYGSRRGVLERVHLRRGACRERVALGVDLHLSYPFLTRIDDQVILIPEMSASRMTRLYRIGAGRELDHLATLPVPGIDPVLYRWEGRYWLGLTRADIDARSNYCLWHATELTGPWIPHDRNPVKIDVRSSRNAGTPFLHDGQFYRPAQDCSAGYGRAVAINRVVECTPRTYREEVAAVVRPKRHWPVPDGLHTLSRCGDRTLIDAKVSVVSACGLWTKVRRLLRKPPVLVPATPRHDEPQS